MTLANIFKGRERNKTNGSHGKRRLTLEGLECRQMLSGIPTFPNAEILGISYDAAHHVLTILRNQRQGQCYGGLRRAAKSLPGRLAHWNWASITAS